MKLTLLMLLLLSIPSFSFSQDNYDVDIIPANLKNRANSCIRNEETVIDMRTPENVILTVKKAITVLNENGEDDARLFLHYDKNTAIKSIKGEIYNAVGKITSKFSQSNFNDISAVDGFSMFTDSRVKYFSPEVNQYPYTVMYNYEIRSKQNLIIPKWTPKPSDDVSVEKSSYTFISKPTDQVRIKAQNYNGNPEVFADDKQKKITWKADNIFAIKPEPYYPNLETYQTSVQVAPEFFNYYNHKGSYNNWQELGKWVYDDLIKQRNTLSPSTIQMVKDLVKDEKNDVDKARKIYQYLQNKTRYISIQIGIGGFQPIAAGEVDRLGYGDCKALVNYMQSLLKAVDIESLYCVVEAGSFKKSIDPNFADMTQGNHIILCLPLKGDTIWLECTNQKIPFGFLGDFTDDRLVFACTPEGGKILRTPKLSTQNNRQIRDVTLKIGENGNAIGYIKTVFYGSQYDNHESLLNKSISDQQKLLKEIYNIDHINFEKVVLKQEKSIDPNSTEDITINIRSYAPVNEKKMYLQLNQFNVSKTIPEIRNRVLPVYINRGYTDEDKISYQLPENVNTNLIQSEEKNFKCDFGIYQAKILIEGNKLTYHRKLIINEGTWPAVQYKEFYKFMEDVNSADRLKLALSLK